MKHVRFTLMASAILSLVMIAGGFLVFHSSPTKAYAGGAPCIQFGAFVRSISYIEAEKHGFFAQEGLNVCYNQVTGSVQQFDSLLSGQYDMISTATDNAANRYVNSQAPIQIVSAFDKGEGLDLVVNTANGIHTIADLRGKAIAVDAPDSGFVFALRKILAGSGLYLEHNDYSLQVIGGAFQRYSALVAGKTTSGAPVYATILVSPFTERSRTVATLSDLAQFSSFVAPYQSTGLVVTNSYAAAHPDTITSFIAATILGERFAADPANKATVISDIAATFNLPTPVATDVYATSQSSVTGENADEEIDTDGLANVLDLRQQFGGFNTAVDSKKLAHPHKDGLYNDEFWKDALKQVKKQGK